MSLARIACSVRPGPSAPTRIATFSSAADKLTYEMGGAGSELFDAMIRHGMIEGGSFVRTLTTHFNT